MSHLRLKSNPTMNIQNMEIKPNYDVKIANKKLRPLGRLHDKKNGGDRR
jgi:hypothetical protein